MLEPQVFESLHFEFEGVQVTGGDVGFESLDLLLRSICDTAAHHSRFSKPTSVEFFVAKGQVLWLELGRFWRFNLRRQGKGKSELSLDLLIDVS